MINSKQFSIGFSRKHASYLGEDETLGEIWLNGVRERFSVYIGHWDKDQYRAHWWLALQRVVNEKQPARLFTNMNHIDYAEYFRAWICYPEGDKVFVQEHMIFPDQMPPEFSHETPHLAIPPRTIEEEGQKISEWEVSIQDLITFLDKEAIS